MTAFYNFLITGGSLSTNTAVNGGGAYVASSGSLTVSGGTMNGNTTARGLFETACFRRNHQRQRGH